MFRNAFDKKQCLLLLPTAPIEVSILTTSLSAVFALTNIPGNLLIILAVVIDPNKNLRSPFNWLIVNLAIADLIVGVITEPLSVYIHLKEALGLGITKADTLSVHLSYFISCTASVLSLSTLAVERYLAVRKPNTYRNEFTEKRIIMTVAGIWFLALSLPQIYFEVGFITYAFVFANTSVLVAVVITCFTYSLMLKNVKERSHKKNDTVASRTNMTTACMPPIPNAETPRPETSNTVLRSALLMESKVTKMLIVVLIALLGCYGPSTIIIYVTNFCESCNCIILHWLRDIQVLFVLMNSSVNFYCYALQSPRLRCAFAKILKLKRRQNREESSLSDMNTRRQLSSGTNTCSIELSERPQWEQPISSQETMGENIGQCFQENMKVEGRV